MRELEKRSGGKCEICGNSEELNVFIVSPKEGKNADENVHACQTCISQLNGADVDMNHWRCLNDAMWSEVDAVKVVSFRMLHQLKAEPWANDLIEMMYMDEHVEEWAKSGITEDSGVKHIDANGVELQNGDTVVLIKDLKVKGGASFTAKRGTAVRNIVLDRDNEKYIEGKVEGQRIVIITDYVKK